jgi:hypothetical protein
MIVNQLLLDHRKGRVMGQVRAHVNKGRLLVRNKWDENRWIL